MKQLSMKVLALFVAIIGLQSATFANSNPDLDKSSITFKTEEDAIVIKMVNLESEVTTINIMNVKGDILFTERIKDENYFATKFDLSNLEAGEYFINVNRSAKKVSTILEVDEAGKILDITTKVTRTPLLIQNENNLVMYDRGSQIKEFGLYSIGGEELFAVSYEEGENTNVNFDVTSLLRGKYNVRIETKDDVYFETINVR